MKHPHAPPLAERIPKPVVQCCVVCRGPTVEQWVAAGYPAEAYPPQGYERTLIPCCRRES